MRKWYLIGLLLLSYCGLPAQESAHEDEVKKTIEKIFEIVDSGRSNVLANYIVYRGEDESRNWKSSCNYYAADDKHRVQEIHQRIVERYLPYKYKYERFFTEKESEGEWLVWEMSFMVNDKTKKVYFAFLKVGNQYLLGDID